MDRKMCKGEGTDKKGCNSGLCVLNSMLHKSVKKKRKTFNSTQMCSSVCLKMNRCQWNLIVPLRMSSTTLSDLICASVACVCARLSKRGKQPHQYRHAMHRFCHAQAKRTEFHRKNENVFKRRKYVRKTIKIRDRSICYRSLTVTAKNKYKTTKTNGHQYNEIHYPKARIFLVFSFNV